MSQVGPVLEAIVYRVNIGRKYPSIFILFRVTRTRIRLLENEIIFINRTYNKTVLLISNCVVLDKNDHVLEQ